MFSFLQCGVQDLSLMWPANLLEFDTPEVSITTVILIRVEKKRDHTNVTIDHINMSLVNSSTSDLMTKMM
jgi:hypothetical protein